MSGISLAPFSRMVIHSLYPSDKPVDPWVNGASDKQNGDFSALILLMLAAGAPQKAPATETAGSSSVSIVNQSTNADTFSKLEAMASEANNYGNASNVAKKSLAESRGMALLPDVRFLQGRSRHPQATIGQIEKRPVLIPSGEEGTGVSARLLRDLRPRSEHLFLGTDAFDETTIAKGSTSGLLEDLPEEFSVGVTQRDLFVKDGDQYQPGDEILLGPVPVNDVIEDNLRSRPFNGSSFPYLSPEGFGNGQIEKDLLLNLKDRDQYQPGDEILLGPVSVDDDVIEGNLKIQSRGMHTLFGGDSTAANQTSDQRMMQSMREREIAREPNKKFPGFHDSGSKFLQQSRLYAESELHTRVMPGNGESVGRFLWSDLHPQKEAVSFQDGNNDGSHEALQMAVETPVESSRTGTVIQVAHTWEKVLKTVTRESQSIEWRPVVERVIEEISGRIRIGARQAVLQLDPPELGRLQIDLYMDGDKLAARILTETQESRTLLETHLPELRQALGDIRVELLDVRIDSGSWSGPRGEGQQEPRHETHNGRQTAEDSNQPNRNFKEREESRRPPGILEAGSVSMWA